MNGRLLLLERSIEHDLQAIERLYAAIGVGDLPDDASEEVLIVVAYRLHNLYSAFENIFQAIAATFENSLDGPGRWHVQLLERMRLDMMPLRPAVIAESAYDALDELRRFRHLFRYSYGVHLDPERLRLVLSKVGRLKAIYRPQLEAFLTFLRRLQAEPEEQAPGSGDPA